MENPNPGLPLGGPIHNTEGLTKRNFILRRLNMKIPQILHQNRLKNFLPNQPLEDSFSEGKLKPDEEIVIP